MTSIPLLCPGIKPSFSSSMNFSTSASSADDTMQSSFGSDLYASSPGGMDFFFGQPPVYDSLGELDAASPFAMPEVVPDVYSFTSSPYMYPTMTDFPIYDSPIQSQNTDNYASSYSSTASWPQETTLSSCPGAAGYDSCPDSPPSESKPAKPFACDNCGKSFTRLADLKRHQSSVHYPIFRNCPVEHCSRKGRNGFPRQDHLVEHLRSYHHLDVPKRRAFKRSAKDAA